MNLIDYSSTLFYDAIAQDAGQIRLNLDSIATAIGQMAEARVNPSRLVINPFRRKDLLMLSTQHAGQPLFLPETSEANMKAGKVGSIMGLSVIEIPSGEATVRRTGATAQKISDVSIVSRQDAYVLGPQNYVGVLAVRTDLTIETQKSVNDFADLFGVWEDLGFLVRYAKGIEKITIPTV